VGKDRCQGKRQLLRRRDAFSINRRFLHRPLRFPSTASAFVRGMTKRRGLLSGQGPLPREKAVAGRRDAFSINHRFLHRPLRYPSTASAFVRGMTKESAVWCPDTNIGAGVSARVAVTAHSKARALGAGFTEIPTEFRRWCRCRFRRVVAARPWPCRFLRGAWLWLRLASGASRPVRARSPGVR
jgi:hypothetical protein